ncbi:MAG: hypothetical protein IT233_10305 [Bacteroidia bacterium]|nr:hypothetical protein [Bacteroidia bacterium]
MVEEDIDRPGWRKDMAGKLGIKVWIEDRLRFSGNHIRELRNAGVFVVGLDLVARDEEYPDLVFSIMPCFYGLCKARSKVFQGMEFFVLDPALREFRRERKEIRKVLVMFGGTDTHSITWKVAEQLQGVYALKVVLGAGTETRMFPAGEKGIEVVRSPELLYKEFPDCDLAVCAGGITPFEMVSTGLPVCMIATEEHEKMNARFIADQGMGVVLGDRLNYDLQPEKFGSLNLAHYSRKGLDSFRHYGAGNIINRIREFA